MWTPSASGERGVSLPEPRALPGAALLGDGRTIAALATVPGRSALALVRLTGHDVRGIAARLLDPPPARARQAGRCTVRDADGTAIDDAMATLFEAPHSFTGEDLLEISTHGGHVTPASVLAAAISLGARLATPGEFTRRAVLNGKLDLLQAEAIADLIDARSGAARHAALRQLDGGLSRRIADLREQVLRLEALLAYDIDFPEEDDGPIPRERIEGTTRGLLHVLRTLLATREQGTLVHEGALVVLAGAPNVGKSSLFNALLGEARAIVTTIPGTTRDAIEAVLDLPGYPLRLVDTAGLRDTSDAVEQLGIDTAGRYLTRAAVVLACGDSAPALAASLGAVRALGADEVLAVRTKRDLEAEGDQFTADVTVSAHTGEGLADLLAAIEGRLARRHGVLSLDAPVLTSARHHAAVAEAERELVAFDAAWRDDALPPSIAAIHVRAAADALGEMIGAVHVEQVLDVVFASFCVGK